MKKRTFLEAASGGEEELLAASLNGVEFLLDAGAVSAAPAVLVRPLRLLAELFSLSLASLSLLSPEKLSATAGLAPTETSAGPAPSSIFPSNEFSAETRSCTMASMQDFLLPCRWLCGGASSPPDSCRRFSLLASPPGQVDVGVDPISVSAVAVV